MSVQDTSLLSWVELQPSLGDREAFVYWGLQQLGNATDQELKVFLNFSDPNSVRPRRNELVKLGLVHAVEKRKCKITQKTVLAFEIIPKRW